MRQLDLRGAIAAIKHALAAPFLIWQVHNPALSFSAASQTRSSTRSPSKVYTSAPWTSMDDLSSQIESKAPKRLGTLTNDTISSSYTRLCGGK